MKRKYREAMRAAARERGTFYDDAADALQQYEETAQRRTLWPPIPVAPCIGEPWRPVMNEQERQQHEQYVKDHSLPF